MYIFVLSISSISNILVYFVYLSSLYRLLVAIVSFVGTTHPTLLKSEVYERLINIPCNGWKLGFEFKKNVKSKVNHLKSAFLVFLLVW